MVLYEKKGLNLLDAGNWWMKRRLLRLWVVCRRINESTVRRLCFGSPLPEYIPSMINCISCTKLSIIYNERRKVLFSDSSFLHPYTRSTLLSRSGSSACKNVSSILNKKTKTSLQNVKVKLEDIMFKLYSRWFYHFFSFFCLLKWVSFV